MTPDQIIATVMALLSAAPQAAPSLPLPGADPRYPVTIDACPRPLPAGEVEGKTVICGHVSVPENHAKPEGKRISLAFGVLRARSLSPAPDPLVYLHGGPGGGAVKDLWSIVVPIFDRHRARRDVVTFDQRAAGISSDMVTCFDTLGANIVSLMAPGKSGQDPEMPALVADCLAELKAKGTDITQYNTTQNARDTQALMRGLGYADWNLYGISYGTQLALEVMRSAPEGTRSVVIDSVFPPDVRGYDENVKPLQESLQAVLDQCAADAACAKSYPDLPATLDRVAAKLQAAPIPAARGRAAIDIRALADLLDSRNGSRATPGITAHLPLLLTELDRGETTTWDLLASGGMVKPPSTAERLAPYAAQLTPEQKALAALLLEQATAAKTTDLARDGALSALSDSLARSAAGGTDLAKRLDAEMTRAIIATGSREAMLDFVRAYAALATQPPSRDAFAMLVRDHLPAADQAPILSLLDLMNEADIRAAHAAVSSEARTAYSSIVFLLDLMVIACQEDFPFNSRAGFDAYNATLKWPWLMASAKADTSAYEICPMFTPAPRAGFLEPVKSDIPTLVLYGLNDTQTSSADARHAAETLSRATALAVPEAGHGAVIFSDCAKDIGLAFVERPETPPDARCLADLRPAFVLPK